MSFHAIINCYIAQSPASSVSPSFAQYADTWDNRILTWAYKGSDKLTYNQDTEGKRKRLKRKRQRERLKRTMKERRGIEVQPDKFPYQKDTIFRLFDTLRI